MHLYCSKMAVREVPDYQGASVKVGTGHPQLTGIRRVGVALLQRGGALLGEVMQKGGEGSEAKCTPQLVKVANLQ